MNVRRVFIINVVIIIAVLALLYFGYSYYYRSTHYVTTDDASIQATTVTIQPQFAGRLLSWSVHNGQKVTAGQVIGTEDTSTEMQQLGSAAKVSSVVSSVRSAANITSPFAGTVTQVDAAVGQSVVPGVPMAVVVDSDHPYVIANVDESAIRYVQGGDTVDVYVDAYPNLSLQGTVQSIGSAANSFFALIPPTDAASGNYTKVMQTIPLKISLSGTAGANLIPGSNATVRIHRNNN